MLQMPVHHDGRHKPGRVCVSVCARCIRVWRRHAKLCPLVLRTPGITPIGFLSCSQLARWLLWILWMPWMPMDSWMLPSSLRHASGSYGSHGCLWIPEDSPGFLTVFLCISLDSYGKAKEKEYSFGFVGIPLYSHAYSSEFLWIPVDSDGKANKQYSY